MSLLNSLHRSGVWVVLLLVAAGLTLGSCGKKSDDAASEEAAAPRQARADEPAPEPVAPAEAGPEVASDASRQDSPEPSVDDRRTEQKAPDFVLADVMSGSEVRLSDYRGKVVLIDFWATWCGPCRMGIPHLIELHEEYSGDGFTVLGVSVDQKGPSVVKPFVKQQGIPYPVVMGDQPTIRRFGSIRAIPTAFLVDREGYVIGRYEGYRDKDFFEKEIKKLLGQTPVS
jgi:cytochrome c biogenesis protein CcmG/thiol:disulfide interchange protein DsbE